MGEIESQLGAYVRTLRRERNMTQEQLAEQAGLHPTYISRIEGGKSLPALDVIGRLASVFGVSAAELIRAVDPETSDRKPQSLIQEITAALEDCTPAQLRLVRDFVRMIQHGNHGGSSSGGTGGSEGYGRGR